MYLHEDRELFREVITNSAVQMNLAIAVVEKDYYVTMILKVLSEKSDKCVFKGGTSLSKGFHVLNRFSCLFLPDRTDGLSLKQGIPFLIETAELFCYAVINGTGRYVHGTYGTYRKKGERGNGRVEESMGVSPCQLGNGDWNSGKYHTETVAKK
jgi:hypothetical protein